MYTITQVCKIPVFGGSISVWASLGGKPIIFLGRWSVFNVEPKRRWTTSFYKKYHSCHQHKFSYKFLVHGEPQAKQVEWMGIRRHNQSVADINFKWAVKGQGKKPHPSHSLLWLSVQLIILFYQFFPNFWRAETQPTYWSLSTRPWGKCCYFCIFHILLLKSKWTII